jgi:hypothetical protein
MKIVFKDSQNFSQRQDSFCGLINKSNPRDGYKVKFMNTRCFVEWMESTPHQKNQVFAKTMKQKAGFFNSVKMIW